MMTVFSRSGRKTEIKYIRVSFPDFVEHEVIGNITAGKLTENQETSLKVGGTLTFEGAANLGLDDMVRIYSVNDCEGEHETICHATMAVALPSVSLSETNRTGDAQLYSVLKFMQDRLSGDMTVLSAGQNVVDFAKSLIKDCHLAAIADASDYLARTDHVWDAGTDYLSIVNDCLDIAGFNAATVDGYGNVVLHRFQDVSSRKPVATLSDTQSGDGFIIGGREIKNEHDKSSIPNVSYVVITPAEQDATPLVGIARNDDAYSPYSTTNRGREITIRSEYSELSERPEAKALQLLKNAMRVLDKYELQMLFYPLNLGDVVSIEYERLGIEAQAALVKRELTLNHQLVCSCLFRRSVDYFKERSANG